MCLIFVALTSSYYRIPTLQFTSSDLLIIKTGRSEFDNASVLFQKPFAQKLVGSNSLFELVIDVDPNEYWPTLILGLKDEFESDSDLILKIKESDCLGKLIGFEKPSSMQTPDVQETLRFKPGCIREEEYLNRSHLLEIDIYSGSKLLAKYKLTYDITFNGRMVRILSIAL